MKHIQEWLDDFDHDSVLYNNAIRYGKIIEQLDLEDDQLEKFTRDDFISIYRSQCTKTYEDVRTFAYFFRMYLRWLLEKNYIHNREIIYSSLNCNIYKIYREEYANSNRKDYINDQEFFAAYRDARLVFDLNNLWYATFLRCLWEGIYSEKWIAFKELRASDVDLEKHTVHVHGTWGEYDVQVSEQLCKDLIQLSKIDYWEKISAADNIYSVYIEGKYPDSVFKFENRLGKRPFEISDVAFRVRARDTIEQAFGKPIMSKKIFVSGIAYKVKLAAQKQGKTLTEFLNEAYAVKNSPNLQIINNILYGCGIMTFHSQNNYKTKLYNFCTDFE